MMMGEVESAKEVASCLASEANYCYKFSTYFSDLEVAKGQLESTIKNVGRAKDSGIDIGNHGHRQLDEAGAHVKKANKLIEKAKTNSYCYCFRRFPNLICRYWLGRQAAERKSLINELNESLSKSIFGNHKSLRHRNTSENFVNYDSADSVCKQLLKALEDENLTMIGLHGIGGCGKSTLLKKVAKEAEESQLFHKIARVELSDHTSIDDIQDSIIEWLGLVFPTHRVRGTRANRLCETLTGEKKYLIILDGVWENLEYDAIGIPDHKNCTVLIATRSQEVCRLRKCQEVISLGLLNDDEGWQLFQKHAGIIDENNSLRPLARKISDKCGGLPIAIEAIARSLEKKPEADWEAALKKLRHHQPVDIIEDHINPYNRLKSSFDRLRDDGNEAKKLFLLCSLFPEDSEIQVEDLIRSTIGLGIYGESDCYENARNQIESRMQNLIGSNLLLQGRERRSVIMHNICRAVVLERAKEIQVLRDSTMEVPEEGIMKYSYCHIKECPNPFNIPKCEILFLYHDGKYSLTDPDPFFKEKKGLQVLIIVARSSQHTLTLLLLSMKWLTNLQALCLKGCRLDGKVFPRDLQKLEILEFSECTITELPREIAKLQKLRLLEVSGCEIGGNPYEVLGSCSHLEELYFLGNQLSEEVSSDRNDLADFFDKEKGFSPKLQRYQLQIGRGKDGIEGNGDLRLRILSISDFVASTCSATIEDLVKRANVLFLNKIHGFCESIIPGIVQTGVMTELIELQLSESDGMKFVIDASQNLSEAGYVLSKLKRLKITKMECLVALCCGQLPASLFEELEELEVSECSELQSILFLENLKLHSLKVLELKECPMLISLFSPAIAQSLVLLEVLKITNCNGLKHIIEDEGSEIFSNDRPSVFPELAELCVIECHQLEYLMPVSLAMGLKRLKSLVIHRASMLKYVFGQSSENQNESQTVNLPALKQLELLQLPIIHRICSGKHVPSWPSFAGQVISGCPRLTIMTAGTSMQEIVLKVDMNCDKCMTKALKVAAETGGVNSVEVQREGKQEVVVTGYRIDAVKLLKSLRKKVGHAELISVAGGNTHQKVNRSYMDWKWAHSKTFEKQAELTSTTAATADNVCAAIMRHLADSASYHSSFLFRYDNIIKNLAEAKYELTEKRKSVLDQVKRARDDHQIIAPKVLDWLQETGTVIARAEDMETRVKNVSYCHVQFPDLKRRHRNGKEAAKATQEMKYLYEHSFQFREFTCRVTLGLVNTRKDIVYSQSAVLAYKELLEALVDGEINAIGLYGMGGCGKTTLMKELGGEAKNMRLFDEVIFVGVSRRPIIRDIQGTIADYLGLRLLEETEAGRAARLDMRFRFISGERNLIILDDVWEKLDYEAIGIPFGPNTGCTVVIATRRQQVCTLMDCQKVISLGLLNEDEAWTLFQKHANITNGNSNILSQAREISNKCQGLPIAIAAVATSLKGKTDADWEIALQKFRDHELVDFDHGVVDPYKCLQLSYDDLRDDNTAKDLFLLCSLFPEDSEIQVEDLIRSGTGLGIFGKADSYNSARREIESTINKLMRSNLLRQGKEKGSVILHGLFRDVAWDIAKNKIQLIIESGLASAGCDQIRYLHCHNKDYFQNQPDFQKFEILFVYKDGNISSRVPDSFFQRMEGLQVLNVANRSLTPTLLLPESLKLLTELRTLCLKGCRLDEMFFLRNLEQLQTLEFCECGINELPTEIAELQKLRLLDVSRCRIGGNPYKVIGSSSNLEELYFLENQLSEIVPSDDNLAGFFDQEKGFSPMLQRYHLQIGSCMDNIKGNGDLRSKMLSISPFVASSSNATINDLVQKSQVLFLENIHAGCRNIIPDLVQTGGMNELIELLLGGSDEIECVVDSSKNLSEAGPVFSKLNKLTITRMEPLVVLCHGQPPLGLFGKLEELKITECTKLQSIGDLKLPCLKVLELEECQMLICLFSPAIAQSWERLQVLKITNCNELKHIIAEERSEIVSEEERPSVFAQLEELSVTKCHQLEYLIPVWLATGLERLESLVIDDAYSLRYVFGQSESSSFDNQNEKSPRSSNFRV